MEKRLRVLVLQTHPPLMRIMLVLTEAAHWVHSDLSVPEAQRPRDTKTFTIHIDNQVRAVLGPLLADTTTQTHDTEV